MRDQINILTIDDSALVRMALTEILSGHPDLQLIGSAGDPFEAAKIMQHVKPDVIVLDIEMPKMDGLTFLAKLMSQHPIPVVVLSTLTERSSEIGIKALELGAIEVLNKPRVDIKGDLKDSTSHLIDVIRFAASIDVKKIRYNLSVTEENRFIRHERFSDHWNNQKVACIGASTGGTQVLKRVLKDLPPEFPGVLVVQHMPAAFTGQFARHLDKVCRMNVREASDGDVVRPGKILIAPGGRHMMLKKGIDGYFVQVKDGPRVSMHKPSVDVLFRSAAHHAAADALGIIMTGMGRDGAQGLLELKSVGANTIAQSEESCVVFGMPKEAMKLGAVMFSDEPCAITDRMITWARRDIQSSQTIKQNSYDQRTTRQRA